MLSAYQYIKEKIKDKNIVQKDFAKKLNIKEEELSVILNGKRTISTEMAIKIAKILNESPLEILNLQSNYEIFLKQSKAKGYVIADSYEEGFIGYLDILGFGAYSKKQENFEKISELFNTCLPFVNTHNINFTDSTFIIMSDSILLVYPNNKKEAYCYDTIFETILENITLFKYFINQTTGLDVRASITYGNFLCTNNNKIIFGPAVTRAVEIAEKLEIIPKNGAGIIVDNIIKIYANNNGNSPFNYLLYDIIKSHPDRYFPSAFDNNYFIYNPYFHICGQILFNYGFNNLSKNEREQKIKEYIESQKKRLDLNCSINIKTASKYINEKDCLNRFIKTYEKNNMKQ